MNILVAGCGTGKHAIQAALCYPSSQITAVDLSLSSLAFAKRKAQDLHIHNLEFFQADILALEGLGRQFQIIESIGVLHHLREPIEGWRILTSLLADAGMMYIGLYSAIARAALVPGKQYIASKGLSRDAAGIRLFRKQVLAEQGSELAKIACFSEDFYSLSGCRDLFFHVQEHQYTLSQLSKILAELNLRFLGFDLPSDKFELYRAFNPEDPRGLNLSVWHKFELENPRTFSGMYKMWIQKIG
ncbi:class I SAM-dependent methyltransferase [Sulfurirhabdus autotrophica]|uniref:Methyltransferase family protein n=1 Tax=Sulfurirhabdus autotrophica TaxID=1706046 RepID=A0A4R3XT66_9PROT|nr:class I SAM-dependent methyltransferase [Sulfurirhabdus autotrophica]TCV79181.1 methyltransferase family protein [Sulfurirhabdus autotrophica]